MRTAVYGGENTAWVIQYSDDEKLWLDATTTALRLKEFQWNEFKWPYLGAHRYWRYLCVENNDSPSYFGYRWFVY